jgi:20S proteasome subunit alpha 2
VDPSGSYWAWKASSIGKNMINANTFLEKRYKDDIELEDAINIAMLTLKDGFDEQMNEDNIELAYIDKNQKFKILNTSEIKDYLDDMNKK